MKKQLLLLMLTLLCSIGMWADSWELVTDYSNLDVNGTYVIACNHQGSGTYYTLKNTAITSNANPTAFEITVSDGKITSTVSDDMKWKISVADATNKYYYIYSNADNKNYLQNANNIGSQINEKHSKDENNQWEIHKTVTSGSGNSAVTVKGLYNVGQSRMLGTYSGTTGYDWRAYKSTNYSNIKSCETVLFKLTTSGSDTPVTEQYSYTLETVGEGTVVFKDANNNTIAPNQNVDKGTKITPTFTPAEGYEFTSWEYYTTAGAWSKVNGTEFTISKDVQFRVTFTEIQQGGDDPTPGDNDIAGKYVLTSLDDIENTDNVILVWTVGENNYAITNNNGTTSAPAAVAQTISDNTINNTSDAIVWNIKKSADGTTFEIHSSADNTKYLYCTNTNNGVRVGKGEAKTFQIKDNYLYEDGTTEARYLGIYNNADIRCYTSINSNIKDQALSFYVKKAEPTPTPADGTIDFVAAGTDGYYATFSNSKAVTIPNMIEIGEEYAQFTVYSVYTVGNMIELKDLSSTMLYDDTWYLSENEGYLVKAEYSGEVAFTGETALSVEYTELDYNLNNQDKDNALRPSSEAMSADKKNYKLAYKSGSNQAPATLGFYWGANEGAPFAVRDNSAYLALPKETLAKGFSFIDVEATAIKNVNTTAVRSNAVYNLAGQRVSKNAKGIIIVNGKKLLNK